MAENSESLSPYSKIDILNNTETDISLVIIDSKYYDKYDNYPFDVSSSISSSNKEEEEQQQQQQHLKKQDDTNDLERGISSQYSFMSSLKSCHAFSSEQITETRKRYDDFFAERNLKKQKLYRSVVIFGLILSLNFALAQVFINLILEMKLVTLSVCVFLSILKLIFISIMVFGISVFSSVPVDEFNIDRDRAKYKLIDIYIRVLFLILNTTIGIYVLQYRPYFLGGIMILYTFLWIFHDVAYFCDISRRYVLKIPSTLKMTLSFYFMILSVFFNRLFQAINPTAYNSSALYGVDTLEGADMYTVSQILYAIDSALSLFFLLLSLRYSFYVKKIHRFFTYRLYEKDEYIDTDSTSSLFYTIYCMLLLFAIQSLLSSANSLYFLKVSNNNTNNYLYTWLFQMLQAVVIFTTFGFVLITGPKRSFSIMARIFEGNIKRNQKDSAFMAELITSSQVVDTDSNIRWIWRKTAIVDSDMKQLENNNNNLIKRTFWLKGDIIDDEENQLTISISYRCDIDKSWKAYYHNNTNIKIESDSFLIIHQKLSVSEKEAFTIWKNENFVEADIFHTDEEYGYVIKKILLEKTGLDREELLLWANQNLRMFHWLRFYDDLLLKSPRDLNGKEERDLIFKLSQSVKEIKNESDKIDYFISHSWEDDPVVKCKALKAFSIRFYMKRGRYPTFWFDKVCIDQNNTTNALAVLPINIRSCKQMLVLISDSYMKRLWCVWELFTLFTFSNKELAFENIKLLPLIGINEVDVFTNKLDKFTINDAHCFDPNEEFKLRSIMSDVGIGRFTEGIKEISKHFNIIEIMKKHEL